MDTLLHKFHTEIKGILEGFDRFVFKGFLRPICFTAGMQVFLNRKGVLNKDYKSWATGASAAIIRDAENYLKEQQGSDSEIQYLASCHIRKETLAHAQQKKSGIQDGLIGIWSCLESCNTFKATYDKAAGFPQIRFADSRCKHLYFYYDHEDFGFMSIRLQTWAPYEIQIALNGRQWLKRMLDKVGAKYILEGNKFLYMEDYELAGQLLESQLDTRWIEMLSSFLPNVFPSMRTLLSEDINYTWTLWQSEWAKDYVFRDPLALKFHMDHLLRHAYITGTSDRVLRYMGRPVLENGQPHWTADPELMSRVNLWYDGARIRHWLDKNSLKLYNEQNVLRFEFTMNDPTKILINRTVRGDDSGKKKRLPMRKGIEDIVVRTQVCSSRIKNFTEQVATLEEDTSVGELLSGVSKPVKSGGKIYRSLDLTGKDMLLLQTVADPKFNIDAITNKHLQRALGGTLWAKRLKNRSLSGRISRHLRLLREHGIIKKLPNQHKYLLTAKGRSLTTALNQLLGANVSDLSKLAA